MRRRRGGTPGAARRCDERSRRGAGRAAAGRGPIGGDDRSPRGSGRCTAGSVAENPRRSDTGSALVESLVALVLVAIAGALVASAARSALRSAARAATLTRASALAGRELARVAGRAAAAVAGEATLTVTGFPDPVVCTTDVARDVALVTLAVDVVAGRPSERVSLATRRFLAPPAGQ